MKARIAVSFLIGCLTGGFFVAMWTARGPRSPPPSLAAASPSVAVPPGRAEPPDARTQPSSVPATTPAPALPRDRTPTGDGPHPESSAPTYDFTRVVNTDQRLEEIFAAERADPVWAPQTVDSLNLVLSQMPERSVIGDYGLTCKQSLCKLEIKGSPDQIMPPRTENNVQTALMRVLAEPPANELFDDSTMRVEMGKDNVATITIFAHRRKPR